MAVLSWWSDKAPAIESRRRPRVQRVTRTSRSGKTPIEQYLRIVCHNFFSAFVALVGLELGGAILIYKTVVAVIYLGSRLTKALRAAAHPPSPSTKGVPNQCFF
jgi:hypothetical protein